MFRERWVAVLLVAYVSFALSYEYHDRIERPKESARIRYHGSILDGSGENAVRTRLLIPWVAEFAANTLTRTAGFTPVKAFNAAYFCLNVAGLLLFFGAMWRLLVDWSPRPLAIAGILLAAFMMALTFRDQFFHPWSFWEPAFFALGMLLLRSGQIAAFAALCAVAVVNRETSIFLPLAFCVHCWRGASPRPVALMAGGTLLGCTALLLVLRSVTGAEPPLDGYLQENFQRNLATGWYSLLLNAHLLGPVWWLAARGLPDAPALVRSFALALIPYLGLLVTVSVWWEIRYWLTAAPVLVPAILAGIQSYFPGPARPNGCKCPIISSATETG